MRTIGLCTQSSATDDLALEYALRLANTACARLMICHWLDSPFTLRRDMVYDRLEGSDQVVEATPEVLGHLELALRAQYEPRLGDFHEVEFRVFPGAYQVELVRCFRKNLLDLAVMGYQPGATDSAPRDVPMEEFAAGLPYPVVLVGRDGPGGLLLNEKAGELAEQLDLAGRSWQVLPAHRMPA